MSRYEVRRYDTAGNVLDIIGDIHKLTYIRTENEVGAMELILPMGSRKHSDFSRNQILEIWREKNGVTTLQNETAYFLQDWISYSDREGRHLMRLLAKDANWLLETRMHLYIENSTEDVKTDYADDMMKEIVTQNLGADADCFLASTGITRILPRFTVQGDKSASEEITRECALRNVLTLCQEIAEAATEAGTNTYFDVVRTDVATFEFRTYTGQRGIDHSRDSYDVRLIGEGYGNLEESTYGTYYSDEATWALVGGKQVGSNRAYYRVPLENRINRGSPYNLKEIFVNATKVENVTGYGLRAEGRRELRQRKSKRIISGKLVDTPGVQFDIHYGFGDIVSVESFGYSIDCHVSSLNVRVDPDKHETINVGLWGEV